MGVHKFHSKAIRFNGYTDGLVVPTGQFKETGVNLLRPTYTGSANTVVSDATKIGRIHYPSEDNVLNRIMGPFTIDAYIVPDYGGVVVDKPGCFSLSVGKPFTTGPITFSVHTTKGSVQIETNFDIPIYTSSHSGAYPSGDHKPQDLTLGSQPLMMITAQFTGDTMKIFLNTELAAELSFGGETYILDNVSSDLFIGGKGGDYRGIIESVRISRGVVVPFLEPLSIRDETVGLWDFNDDIPVPSTYFFDNAHPASPSQGRDGPDTHVGLLEEPLCLIGYDFHNVGDDGSFKIRDFPLNRGGANDVYTPYEKLASLMTGIALESVKDQTWYISGLLFGSGASLGGISAGLDYGEGGHKALPQSRLNAIINQSGTYPTTGLSKTATSANRLPPIAPADPATGFSNWVLNTNIIEDLDPMVNPIERVRIHGISFTTPAVICQSVHLVNDESSTTHGIGGVENHPKGQGLIYHHPDDTPIWLTFGNADLLIDPGNKNTNLVANPGQVTRGKDAFTRATFTQGQRFEDRTMNRNTAYFMSIQSRSPKTLPANVSAPLTTIITGPDPPKNNLLVWIPARGSSTPTDGVVQPIFTDHSGNNHHFFPGGGAGNWVYEANSSLFNGQPCFRGGGSNIGWGNFADPTRNAVKLAHSGNAITVFMMMRPQYDSIAPIRPMRWLGNNGAPITTLDTDASVPLTTLTTAGGPAVTGTYFPQENQSGVFCAVFRSSNTSVETWFGGVPWQVLTPIHTPINFGAGDFGLFGEMTGTGVFTGVIWPIFSSTFYPEHDFRVAEILIYEGELTTADILAVHGYFMDVYGFI